MTVRTRLALAAAAVVLLVAGGVLGYWWAQPRTGADPFAGPPAAAAGDRDVLYWYDPMVPDQHFDKPGKSPFMDMQLVPKYAEDAGDDRQGIAVAAEVRRNLGIRTVAVGRGRLEGALTVPGTIAWDLRREHVVSLPVEAVILQLHVKVPFETVRTGQPVVTVLAPAWGTALAEAGALAGAASPQARALHGAARQRLRALGLPAGARAGADGSVVLTAPADGVVTEIGVREGQAAQPGALLVRINDSATVWLQAAVPQAEVGGLRAGTPVEASVSALAGRRFEGRVDALLPDVDPGNRTQTVRIVLDNPEGLLAPGMYAEVRLRPDGGAEVPLVPTDAVIGSGDRARVIGLDADDRFVPLAVRIGRSAGGWTEILSGLEGGERVVASGQFLIDSEASLSGALERLGAGAGTPTPSPPYARGNGGQRQDSAPAVRHCTVLYWYDPMVPDRHFDQPGKSPFMEMLLVPKFASDADPGCTVQDVAAAGVEGGGSDDGDDDADTGHAGHDRVHP